MVPGVMLVWIRLASCKNSSARAVFGGKRCTAWDQTYLEQALLDLDLIELDLGTCMRRYGRGKRRRDMLCDKHDLCAALFKRLHHLEDARMAEP